MLEYVPMFPSIDIRLILFSMESFIESFMESSSESGQCLFVTKGISPQINTCCLESTVAAAAAASRRLKFGGNRCQDVCGGSTQMWLHPGRGSCCSGREPRARDGCTSPFGSPYCGRGAFSPSGQNGVLHIINSSFEY